MEKNKEITNNTKEKKFKKTPIWKIILTFILIFGTIGLGIFGLVKCSIEVEKSTFKIKYISNDKTLTHIILNIEISDMKNIYNGTNIYTEDFSAKENNLPIQAKYIIKNETKYETKINFNTGIMSIYFDKTDFENIDSLTFYYKGNKLEFGKNIKIEV